MTASNGDFDSPGTVVLDVAGLQALIDLLRGRGYTVLGPTRRGGAIVHAEIGSVADLPKGLGDTQDGATYRLQPRSDEALFGYAAAANSWKSVLYPAQQLLWRSAVQPDGGRQVEGAPLDETPRALLGVRSCDLHAIAIQDRVLQGRAFADTNYAARRQRLVIIAVSCGEPGGTCFCASMGTGPRPDAGYDLSLTELLDGRGHRFLAEPGSDVGAGLLTELPARPAEDGDRTAAAGVTEQAVGRMGRVMDTTGIRDLLYANAEHPRWDDVAARCLSCGNCTLACPTCFCSAGHDVTSLDGSEVEHFRVWDSCYTLDFSHLPGGSVRASPKSRYRQWMTHKLASWIDQFGTSGCVGCGRCITWCPVAIDITEEVAAIRSSPGAGAPARSGPPGKEA